MTNLLRSISVALLLLVTMAFGKSFEETFAFLENCRLTYDNIYYDLTENQFKNSDYFKSHSYAPCELENFDPKAFKVFCVTENFYSLPVSHVIIPTSDIVLYGIVLNKPMPEVKSVLVGQFKYQDYSSEVFGKALLSKFGNEQTLLSCEIENRMD